MSCCFISIQALLQQEANLLQLSNVSIQTDVKIEFSNTTKKFESVIPANEPNLVDFIYSTDQMTRALVRQDPFCREFW